MGYFIVHLKIPVFILTQPYYVDADGKPMDLKVMGKDYGIINHLTNETIVYGNSVINPDIQQHFIQEKNKLKQ